MKLDNFLSLDPEYKGVGLRRGSKHDKEVWDEFANDIYKLTQITSSIRRNGKIIKEQMPTYDYSLGESEEEFTEGKLLTQLHKYKERNHRAAEQKRRKTLGQTGKLLCEVCGFDFVRVYGDLGYGFAECHHTVPVSELTENDKTKLSDLAIVCANCHCMIHRSKPMLTIKQLSIIVKQNI